MDSLLVLTAFVIGMGFFFSVMTLLVFALDLDRTAWDRSCTETVLSPLVIAVGFMACVWTAGAPVIAVVIWQLWKKLTHPDSRIW